MRRPCKTGLLRRATSSYQAGNLDEVQKLYERILKAEPRNAEAKRLLSVTHFHLGLSRLATDRDAGIKTLESAIALQPTFSDARFASCIAELAPRLRR